MADADKGHLIQMMHQETESASSQAVLAFLYLYLRTFRELVPVHICIRSLLPVGAGLGSSASYSVCLVGGLLTLSNKLKSLTLEELSIVNDWAFVSEKVIHGNPSGIDNSVCTFGGAVLYSKGKMEPLEGFTRLKFLLVNTNVPKDTRTQVANVRKRRDAFPQVMEPIFEAVQGISDTCRRAFVTKMEPAALEDTMERLIDMNHCLMDACGVSHPSLSQLRAITQKHGLFSKLTGAGGGGCALTLLRDSTNTQDVQLVSADLEAAGYSAFVTSVGCPGLQNVQLPPCSFDDFSKMTLPTSTTE
jgi:mevalonate kinase